jgi:hypothetical protein
LDYFGFFDDGGEWLENPKKQALKLQEDLNKYLDDAHRPTIMVAIYDLITGGVKYYD